ncbi:MAG: hypothetical protein A6F71_10650 [Cycloclasticus sp. symbiont of Poecilosclerida sp. M]|nr:MAG: hypothetical protein A6F71_10650 [Cycloclasticus sp. symbiont of Poecilosclerida sp. M]
MPHVQEASWLSEGNDELASLANYCTDQFTTLPFEKSTPLIAPNLTHIDTAFTEKHGSKVVESQNWKKRASPKEEDSAMKVQLNSTLLCVHLCCNHVKCSLALHLPQVLNLMVSGHTAHGPIQKVYSALQVGCNASVKLLLLLSVLLHIFVDRIWPWWVQ